MDRLPKILAYLEARAAGEMAALPPPNGSGDTIDQILDHLTASERQARRDAQRIDWIGAALMALGAPEVPEGSEGDAIDALALGVNMLAEELESTTVSLDYLNDVLDSIPDAVFVTTPDGKFHLRNAAAQRVAGHVEHIDQLFPEGRGKAAFDSSLGEGSSIPVSVVASTLRAGHRVFVARDIASRLALEREVEDARDAAVAASEMKSEFLAAMSHEIRTPINGVVGMSQLLSSTALSPSQQEMTTAISTSAAALLEIVNDVLDFSKIEAGRLELEHLEFDLVETLEQVLDIHAIAAANARDELLLHVATDIPPVIGDDGRIRQVVNNLISNAVKFTHDGQIVIWASATPEGRDRIVVTVEVRDTGIGIAPEQQGRLFEAFSQADSSTARKYGGTGLGLAICRQLLELMDGKIEVESAVGRGTTFSFSVPFPVARAAAESLPRLEGGRILVVDRSVTGREILADQLLRWGANPTLVSEGSEALAQLREHTFDACMVDQDLPGGGGELARRISTSTGLPTVLTCSVLDRPERAVVDSLGPWGVMTKPLRPRQLRRVLWRMIHQRGPEPRPGQETRHLQGRVLVVEDNPINQKVALAQVQSLGLSADVVADGAEAIEAFKSLPYDLILMDVRMPNMDGYEATANIRAIEAKTGGRIPIVALTADAVTDQRKRVLEAGMDDCLTKPATIQTLSAVLSRWLSPGGGIEVRGESTRKTDGVLDGEQIEQLRILAEGDADFLRQLFEDFLASGREHIAALRAAAVAGHLAEVQRQAHSFKGSAGNLGARRVMAVCRKLEEDAKEGHLDGVEQRLDDLAQHLADAQAAFMAL